MLSGQYPLRWQDYSDLPGHYGRFRYLAIEVKDRTATGVEAPPDSVGERKSLVPARVAVAPVSDRVPEPPSRSGRFGTPVP